MITFICTECGVKLRVKDEAGGKRIRCPKCHQPTFVPQEEPRVEIPIDPPVQIPVDPPAIPDKPRYSDTQPTHAGDAPAEYRRRRTRVAEEAMPRSGKIAFILSLVGLAVPIVPSIIAVILAIIGIGAIVRDKLSGMGLTVAALILGLFVPLGHWLVLWPVVSHYTETVERATCVKRLNDIYNVGTFENGMHEWPASLEKLLSAKRLSPELLMCAADARKRPIAYFYMSPETTFPASRIVLCDYGDNHEGVRLVMFIDGRTEWMAADAFNQALREPANARFRQGLIEAEKKMSIQP